MPSWQWRNNRINQAQLHFVCYIVPHVTFGNYVTSLSGSQFIFFFLFIKFMLYSNKNLIIKIDTPTPTSAHIYCNEQRGTTRDWENQPNSTSSIHFQNE